MAVKKVSQETLQLYNALELLNRLGYVEMAVFPNKYNESEVREFYANLITDIDDLDSLVVGQVYMRGKVIAFSPANITDFLSYHIKIEGTGLVVRLILMRLPKCLQKMMITSG